MKKELKSIHTFEHHTDKNLNIFDVIECLIQDEAIKYVDKYKLDKDVDEILQDILDVIGAILVAAITIGIAFFFGSLIVNIFK